MNRARCRQALRRARGLLILSAVLAVGNGLNGQALDNTIRYNEPAADGQPTGQAADRPVPAAGDGGQAMRRSSIMPFVQPGQAAVGADGASGEQLNRPQARRAQPLPLAPPRGERPAAARRGAAPQSPGRAVVTVLGSLSIVIGLLLAVVWLARRLMPKSAVLLPKEAVELLGRAPLTSRHALHLIRLGNKLVLLSVSQGAVEPLAELTDPTEVDRIAGICQRHQPGSITASFQQVLAGLSSESKAPLLQTDHQAMHAEQGRTSRGA